MIRKVTHFFLAVAALLLLYATFHAVGYSKDLLRLSALLIGLSFGLTLVLMFLLNPKVAILTYVLVFPTLQIVMGEAVPIPGSEATVAIGGPLQAIILLAGIYLLAESGLRISKIPAAWIYLFLLFIMGISIFESSDKIRAIKEWGRIGSFTVIYILAMDLFRVEKDISKFVFVLFLSLFAPMVFGAYQFFTQTGYMSELEQVFNRITGTFHNPNQYAMFMAFPFLLASSIVFDSQSTSGARLLFGTVGGILAVSIFLTYGRGSWFGIVAGLLLIAYKRNRSLLFFLTLFLGGLVLVVGFQAIRLGEFATGEIVLSGRLRGWKWMLPLVLENPVIGHGLTDFADIPTQNDHVRLLLETGILGWLLFVWLLTTVFINVNKNYSAATTPLEKNFMLAFLAYLISVVVVGLSQTNAAFQWYVWIPAGIALSRSVEKGREETVAHEESIPAIG